MKATFLFAITLCLLLVFGVATQAQQGFAFNRFTTDDNTFLTSNTIYSLYQDEKGFIWTGTANGLQRFDGSKFVEFGFEKQGNDRMPYSALTQILPLDSGRLFLNFGHIQEFGILHPARLSYRKVAVQAKATLPYKGEYRCWKDGVAGLYLNVMGYGVLRYDKARNAFVDDKPFPFPPAFTPSSIAVYNDTARQRIWFAGSTGICIWDKATRRLWHKGYNPQRIALLQNDSIQDGITQIFIDKKRRIWVTGWPQNGMVGQKKYCLDSTGSRLLTADTVGLLTGPVGYSEYNHFLETPRSGLWVYGVNSLFNWDADNHRFNYTRSTAGTANNSIEYGKVNQMIEDRDGNLWFATDKGLYFTSYGSGTYSVINLLFDNREEDTDITDILEMPGRRFWFATWGKGVMALDARLQPSPVPVITTPPPTDWPNRYRVAATLTWALFRQPGTGEVWVGCQAGVLVIFNPQTATTRYLRPPEANNSTIRYITQDHQGRIWMSTQAGRLIKYEGGRFTVVQEVGGIVYKVFVDRNGMLWLATQDKGLYHVNPQTGAVLRHWTADGTAAGLFSNSGKDIEQLKDGTIVYGAGALNFINPTTGAVRLLQYGDGLPSNSVERLRSDATGSLWIVTSDGLARYNPLNHRINTYGRKDGITLAAKTGFCDYLSSDGYVMFAGDNALVMFKPAMFDKALPPPDAVITDFRIFNRFIPVDSLLQLPKVQLSPNENSVSLHFSSLSYQQRDRLTYHYKLEGVDKDWQAASGVYYQNYSLLPPGDYVFKVYAVNAEGQRSANTTQMRIVIKPPYWKTKWFISAVVFVALLMIYAVHRERLNKLLAVEKIRNKVARDLHDDMGSTLSTINILSAMAKSKMDSDPVKTAGYLGKISDNSQRMMEAMDDIVWSIKPSNDSLQRVTARMREFATNVLEAKDIALHFTVAEDVYAVKLNMEARRDFFLVFKEALNNAAKYAKPTEVWVDVTTKNRLLTVVIRDNGIGFDVAAADGGNGLGNMQKRADGMRGRLTIRSKPGRGTEVSLAVPVG